MKLARNYEEILFENIRLELNMTIQQSKEFIENKTGQSDFLISENTNLSLINSMFNYMTYCEEELLL